jgi:hypothetical protein
MTTIVEDTDTYQPHVWSRLLRSWSHERGHVKLAWATSIPLYRDIKKYTKKKLAPKTLMPTTTLLHFTRVKHVRIDLALIPLKGFRSIENKKFPTKTNKNKPRSDLRDAEQRVRDIRSTYPCRSHNGNIQMNMAGVVILASSPHDPI